MKSLRLKYALVLACVLMTLTTVPALAKDKWIAMTTKNLNIVSNADEGETRDLALKIEQFHFVVSRIFNLGTESFLPVTVVVFKSDGSFKPYKPLYNGKPGNFAGYFQQGQDENIIALNINGNEEHPLSLIFHEYTHLITSYAPREWPLWLKEGIAEVYSTFDINKKEATLGMPVSNHVFLLRNNKFIPLQDLFNVNHNSPSYNEREKQGIFYAESWALTHYLMFGENAARRPQLVEFIKLLGTGMNAERAFPQAFNTDIASMEKELRRYLGKSYYPGTIYTLTSTEGEKDVSTRPLPEAESLSHLGNLLMRTGRLDEADQHFKQAVALDANLARPYEGLGFVEMRRHNYEKALEHFKQAVERDSKNHLAHYYYAEALEREARGQITPELARKIISELKTSIKIMPRFAYSYYKLGFLCLVTGDNLKDGAELLKAALRLSPQEKHFALTLAQIQLRMQDYAAAKKTLEPLIAGDAEEGVKQSARSFMNMIENFERPAPIAEQANDRAAESETTSPAKETNHPGGTPTYQMIGQPTLRFAGAQITRGVLAAIDCTKGKWVLIVKLADKQVRFAVGDKDKLEFYSQDPQFDGTIACGAVNRPAFIYFKPMPADQTAFAGDVVAVEFTK